MSYTSVYGQVISWRYGRSLGIDPIGLVSTCSFNCVIEWLDIIAGIKQFRQEYEGNLAIQTMILSPWSDEAQGKYIGLMQELRPEEIQLNKPTRGRSLTRQLETRGNDPQTPPDSVQVLKPVSVDFLQVFAAKIHSSTGIAVRHRDFRF